MEEPKRLKVLPEFEIPPLTQYDLNLLRARLHGQERHFAEMGDIMNDWLAEAFPGYDTRPVGFSRYHSFVYFIQQGEDGPIKIGVSNDPYRRLAQLQTAHAGWLRLVLAFPGERDDERALHERLNNLRVGGEWFHYCEWLAEFTTKLRLRMYGAYGESCYA